MKKKPKYNQESVIRGALRRAFARSPLVQQKMMESRREVARYNKDGSRHKKNWVQRQCEVCSNWSSTSKMAVDHIDPVISVEHGKQDWNVFIDRLWCNTLGIANLQRICDDCHNKKTAQERYQRMFNQELKQLNDITFEINVTPDVIKQFVKKFTNKRLTKYPYPKDFVDRIKNLRSFVGLKV